MTGDVADGAARVRVDEPSNGMAERLESFFLDEIELGSFPGAACVVGDSSGVVFERSFGHAVVKPVEIEATTETIWDVASLTKPLVTSTLTLQAVSEGVIGLEDRAALYMPELDQTEKRNVTILDLMTHRAGFQAWYPLYTRGTGDNAYLEEIVHRPLRYLPGTRVIYSCLGYILLHQMLERIYEDTVESMAGARIFRPLGLDSAIFSPPHSLRDRIAATEWGNVNERVMVRQRELEFDLFRDSMIWGEVNDGNAFYMGGMAGNAGLFATARDVFEIARAYLDRQERILPDELVRKSRENHTAGLDEARGLGWQLRIARPDHPSFVFSEEVFGHTGFTGTSVFVDPPRDLIVVILTNRLHPSAGPINTQAIRRRAHEIVVDSWDR